MVDWMTIQNMTFEVGQTLTLVGVIKPNPKEFTLDICPSVDRIAFHFNSRFNAKGRTNTIVCNSLEAGNWCKEQIVDSFPFYEGKEFKMSIEFTLPEFVVTLPDGSNFRFPNRMGAEKYSIIGFGQDARFGSIEIK